MTISEKQNEIDDCIIQFPGAVAASRSEGSRLAAMYEDSRQVSFRLCLPTIGDKFSSLNRRINEAGTQELVEAADEIILGSYARLAIREAARYEEAYNRLVEAPGRVAAGVMTSDSRLEELRADRDKTVASHLKVRERLARIRRLEALVEKTRTEAAQHLVAKKRCYGAV